MRASITCSTDEILHDYLHGRLTEETEEATKAHLEVCESCRIALERLAGDDESWREAGEFLADLEETGPVDDRPGLDSDSRREALRQSGIEGYLTRWMGATDDPTKMGRVGPFEVVGIIGVGGAGIVLKALDARLSRYVALKVLLPNLAHNAEARKRFEREARAVAAIAHLNVVPIHAVDTHNEIPYIAMHYVCGKTLQQRIDSQGALQVVEVVRIAAQIARALAAAHSQGVIHRDIKPANVLLENNVDRVVVADFGLARVIDDASSHSGVVTGTPLYMSPEQCHGIAADPRSDLFSLGSVMYAMCVGRPPFKAETLMGALRKVCDSTPRSIRDVNPDVPEWLEALIGRLMRKGRDERFPDANRVATILEAELAHHQNPTAVPTPDREWMPRVKTASKLNRPVKVGLAMIGSLAFGAFLLAPPAAKEQEKANEPVKPAAVAALPAPSSPEMTSRQDKAGKVVYDCNIERTFEIPQGLLLNLDVRDANVELAGGDTKQVQVKVLRQVKEASSEAVARARFDRHTVDFHLKGYQLAIQDSDRPRPNPKERENEHLNVKYVISVPQKSDLILNTADGNIAIARVAGTVRLTSSDGNLFAEDCQGHFVLHTADGNVGLRTCGGVVTAKTRDGNIELLDVTCDPNKEIVAETHDGNAHLARCKGSVSVTAHDGNIRLLDCDGTVSATTSEGSIDLRECDGTLSAMTHHGRVHATKWSGTLVTPTGKEQRSRQ